MRNLSWSPRRAVALLVATAAALFLTSSAQAFTFFDTGESAGNPSGPLIGVNFTAADVGSSFDIDWSVGSRTLGTTDELSATATYELRAFGASEFELAVTIRNTTVLSSTLTNADILSTGFGVDPDATATYVSSGSVFDRIGDGSGPAMNYPGGFSGIDVCTYGQNCSGGSVAQGLHAGDADRFLLRVTGDFRSGDVDLLYFPMKFQTNIGSFEPGGSPPIPEPSAAMLFLVGTLVAQGAVRRR